MDDSEAAGEPDNRVRWLTGVVGPASFATAAVLAALVVDRSDAGAGSYSHVHQFVSELAATGSPGRWIMAGGFVTYGASQLLFGRALHQSRLIGATTAATLVTVSGLATVGAGAFACDPGCPTTGDRSISQQIHDVTSFVAFVAWIAVALLMARRAWPSRYGRWSAALGGVQALAAISLLILGASSDEGPVGLVQRVSLAAAGTWFVLTTLQARAGSPET